VHDWWSIWRDQQSRIYRGERGGGVIALILVRQYGLDGLVPATDGRTQDRDGRLASRGKPDGRLLTKLLAHPYLSKHPPKSTGREIFGAPMVEELLAIQEARQLSIETLLDVQSVDG
jgi:anhydro-N-acetylmuramic acid kinase